MRLVRARPCRSGPAWRGAALRRGRRSCPARSRRRPGDQLHRGGRVDRPVRHQQRAGAGIEEGAREARERLGALCAAGRRVAGRQDHPVGVELEGGDLGGREIAVVASVALSGGVRIRPGSLVPHLARHRAVGGEVDDAVLGKAPSRSAPSSLVSVAARRDGSRLPAPRSLADRAEFIGRLGQRRLQSNPWMSASPPFRQRSWPFRMPSNSATSSSASRAALLSARAWHIPHMLAFGIPPAKDCRSRCRTGWPRLLWRACAGATRLATEGRDSH